MQANNRKPCYNNFIKQLLTILLLCNILKRKIVFEIIFYKLENGNSPAEDFIMSLNSKMKAKTFRAISLLKEYGNELREPFSKPLRDGLFELRVKLGTDIVRILYFFCKGKLIILTNGFVKKTQRTPEEEINLALKYKADYSKKED